MSVPIEPAETVDAETAAGWLSGDRIHTRFGRRGWSSMVCAYWPRSDVEALFREAGRVDIAGQQARSEGYGLAVYLDGGRACLFVRADVPESAIRFKAGDAVGDN